MSVDDDLELLDSHCTMEELVFNDELAVRSYLRQAWLEGIFAQLIQARLTAGFSQAQLGEKLGKPQSSIARLERGTDLKLSVLWDYLAATGKTPQSKLTLENLDEVEERLRKYFTREPDSKPMLRSKNWIRVQKPSESHGLRQDQIPGQGLKGSEKSAPKDSIKKDQAA